MASLNEMADEFHALFQSFIFKPTKGELIMATLSTLKRRAEKYGMTIRKFKRGEDSYLLELNASLTTSTHNKKFSTASKKFSSKPKTALTRQANRKLSATVKTKCL